MVIRAFRPEDRAALAAAFDRVSTQQVYRRFFSVRRDLSETEIITDIPASFDMTNGIAFPVKNGNPRRSARPLSTDFLT